MDGCVSSSMGFSCEDVDIIDGKTREAPSVEEEEVVDMVLGGGVLYGGSSGSSSSSSSSSSTRRNRLMEDIGEKMEFWPLQHPMEPPSEDQPVKCPITHHNYYYSSSPPHITMPKEEAAAALAKQYYLIDSPRTSAHVDDAEMKKKKKKKKLDGEISAADNEGEPHQTARALRKRHHAHSILSTRSS